MSTKPTCPHCGSPQRYHLTGSGIREFDCRTSVLKDGSGPRTSLCYEREIAALREMLKQRLFFTCGDDRYHRQGYSFTVDAETAIRDINYRDHALYPTADACIQAELEIWMQKPLTEKEV